MKIIVDFKNDASDQDINAFLLENNLTIVQEFNNFEKTYLVEGTVIPPKSDIIEHVIQDDDHHISLLSTVIVSDQNYGKQTLTGSTLTVANDQQNWWKSYVIKNPKLEESSYTIDRRGQNATVYVLDSGIELSHPEFSERNVFNLWSFNNDFTDKKGHGTAIASVITGKTIGLTDATVKSVKIFDPNTPTKQSDLLNALDVIINDVIDNQIDFSVVNCSWIIDKNIFIENKMRTMMDVGIFIVAAAGNSGHAIENVTPASMDEVVTIGAFNDQLMPCDFSNYTGASLTSLTENAVNHGELDGWAPGQDIYAAGLNGSYGNVCGTSIAAGIHSAVIAYNLGYFTPELQAGMSNKNFYNIYSLSRKDLLNLSDPRYASSKNLISTAHETLYLPNIMTYNWFIQGKSDTYVSSNLFNPQYTSTLEILGELPPDYKIYPSGKLVGKNPQINQDFTYFSVPVKLTRTDGEVIDANLEILTIKNTLDPKQVDTGDPVLNLRLQTAYFCDYNFVQCYDPAGGDSCDSSTCYPADCYYLYPDKGNCGSYTFGSCVCTL